MKYSLPWEVWTGIGPPRSVCTSSRKAVVQVLEGLNGERACFPTMQDSQTDCGVEEPTVTPDAMEESWLAALPPTWPILACHRS